MSVLFLRVLGFHEQAHVRADPSLTDRPFLVRNGREIAAVSETAWKSGIRPGMRLSEARGICQGIAEASWSEDLYRSASQEWLDVLCEFSDVIEPLGFDAAFADLSGHADPVWAAEQALAALPLASAALSPTKWVARAAVVRNGEQGLHLALNPREAAASMPIRFLLPLSQEEQSRLEFLGYFTAGRAREVPLDALRRQFGDRGNAVHAVVRGLWVEEVVPKYPESSLGARIAFSGGTEDVQDLEQGARSLAKRLTGFLSEQDRQATRACLTMITESGSEARERVFARALNSAYSLERAIVSMLEPYPVSPVLEMRVRLPDLKQAQRVQTTLPLAEAARHETLIVAERVCRRYGESTLQKASDVTLPRRDLVLRSWRDAVNWR